MQIDVVGDAQAQTGVPPRPVQHRHELLVGPGSHLARKRRSLRLKERDTPARRQMNEGAARRRMHNANQIAPGVPMRDDSDGALPDRRPNFLQQRPTGRCGVHPSSIAPPSPARTRRRPRSRAGGGCFERGLLLWVGQGLLWSRRLAALLEALQVVPAPLDLHGPTEPLGHPVGDRTTRPVLAPVGRRSIQRCAQVLLLFS